jgi:Lrp/AsnC family leucine-responsive transcriptional regulator
MSQNVTKKSLFTYTPSREALDEINIRILDELRHDPRIPMTELGRRIGMSSPAVTERVRRMEESGLIGGFSISINPASLGLPIGVYIRIRPHAGRLAQIAELARSVPEVVECHRITGDDCFLVKAYIPAMEQLDRILDEFLVYGSTTTSIIQSSPVPLRPPPLPISEPEE